MTRWEQLRGVIEKTRAERRKDWQKALVVQLRRAAEKKICAKTEAYRVEKTISGRLIELAPGRDGTTMQSIWPAPAIALVNLTALDDAKLSFRVTLRPDETLEQYTVSVVGKEKASGRAWYVRLDLDDEQKGDGPCSHAMLHAHIGVDPADKAAQNSRVPLPWLDPDEAIAWILSTLDRRLEPN
jgi:hypothetical protein